MKTIMTLSSAIALSFAMGTAVAGTNMADLFVDKFDVNQDSSISGDEVQFVLAEKFTAADANADGLLTQEEMSAAREQHHQERAAEHFAEFDTDGNGSLSAEEFQAGKPPAGRHCGNSERGNSRQETSATREQRRQERPERGNSRQEMSATREQRQQERAVEHFAELDTDGNSSLSVEEFQAGKPPARKHGSRSEQKFSRLDQDGDGMLSSTEVNAPLILRFERLDTDKDGVISTEELSQAPSKHRGGRHHRR